MNQGSHVEVALQCQLLTLLYTPRASENVLLSFFIPHGCLWCLWLIDVYLLLVTQSPVAAINRFVRSTPVSLQLGSLSIIPTSLILTQFHHFELAPFCLVFAFIDRGRNL
jgi:hypothetical protein